jgi:hypothetical protein
MSQRSVTEINVVRVLIQFNLKMPFRTVGSNWTVVLSS